MAFVFLSLIKFISAQSEIILTTYPAFAFSVKTSSIVNTVDDMIQFGGTEGIFGDLNFTQIELIDSNTGEYILLQNVQCSLQNSSDIQINIFSLQSNATNPNNISVSSTKGMTIIFDKIDMQCNGMQNPSSASENIIVGIQFQDLIVTVNITLGANTTSYYTMIPSIASVNSQTNITKYQHNISQLNSTTDWIQQYETALNNKFLSNLNSYIQKLNSHIQSNLSAVYLDDYIYYYPSVNQSQYFFYYGNVSQEQIDQQQLSQSQGQPANDSTQADQSQNSEFQMLLGGFIYFNRTTSLNDAILYYDLESIDPYLILPRDEQGSTLSQEQIDSLTFAEFITYDTSSDENMQISSNFLKSFIYREITSLNFLTDQEIAQNVHSDQLQVSTIQIKIKDPQDLTLQRYNNETTMVVSLFNYDIRVTGNFTQDGEEYFFDVECEYERRDEQSETIVNFYTAHQSDSTNILQVQVQSIDLKLNQDQCDLDLSQKGEFDILVDVSEGFIERNQLQDIINKIQDQLNTNGTTVVSNRINEIIKRYWQPFELVDNELFLYFSEINNPVVSYGDGSLLLAIDMYTKVNTTAIP